MQQSQRVLMYILPFAFIFVIARFPTGLVLYWMTTNLWTVGQGLITRRLIPKTPVAPMMQRRSSRTPPKEPEPSADGAPPADERPAAQQAPAQQAQQPRRVKRKKKRQARR
jgi:YidC/Oxa1 family membrane protein insertase